MPTSPFWLALCACALLASAAEYVFLPGQESWHQTGYQVQATAWAASVSNKSQAYLTYGPYWSPPAAGDYRVTWVLFVDNNSNDNLNLFNLEISDAATQTVMTTLTITREMFVTPFAPQNFTAYFTAPAGLPQLEFRVFYECCSYVEHVTTIVDGPLSGGTFDTFWNDGAHFEFVAKQQFPTVPGGQAGMNVGFQFVTMADGTWYLFHREYEFGPQPAYCKADYARIVVLQSQDQGLTWLNKTVIVPPVPNTPTECASVDGGAFWDPSTQTWHYLGQCLDRTEVWNLCHFTRAGQNPLGPFTPSPYNPVVRQICDDATKHCTKGTGSEGTPEIVMKDALGYFFVTFHGWDPTAVKSARGVAKTLDFVKWVVDDGRTSLPNDAIFSSTDCDTWNIDWAAGGCVGGGEGTVLLSGDYLYHLIEAPDVTLGCLTTPGQQNWVLGLLRSPSFAAVSGQWQQFQVQPVVVPAVKQGCYIQYHRLFEDRATGVIYLEFWADNWMQLFKLMPGAGALPIVAGPPQLLQLIM